MRQNYMICHKDLGNIGYYFLDKKQEDQFLESINYEFALRVGEALLSRVSTDKKKSLCGLSQEELFSFIEKTFHGFEEEVIMTREILLKEIRENRRTILLEI